MIPLFKPYMPVLPEINNILYSGNLAYGNYTKEFEDKLKKYFHTDYLITTNTFTNAIMVVITALNLKSGDEIISSPMACLNSTLPFSSFGLNLKWADIVLNSGTLNPSYVKKIISDNTKCILHNHFCGYPGLIDEINEIGNDYNIPVIDDGIECFGSEYKGKKIGNCGTDITIFSLGPVRMLNTIDGGIVIFKDKELYEKSLLIRDCGVDRHHFRDSNGEINLDYDVISHGYGAMMSDINGYIGCRQMDSIDSLILNQRVNAKRWDEYICDKDMIPLGNKDTKPNYWVYGFLTNNKEKMMNKLREDGYYASGVHANNNIYSVFGEKVKLPITTKFTNNYLALPCGWWLDSS